MVSGAPAVNKTNGIWHSRVQVGTDFGFKADSVLAVNFRSGFQSCWYEKGATNAPSLRSSDQTESLFERETDIAVPMCKTEQLDVILTRSGYVELGTSLPAIGSTKRGTTCALGAAS